MKALLKKEFLLNQSFIWTILIMIPFAYVINVGGIPVVFGIMIGYVSGLFYYDNQVGMNKFVVSLPITRQMVINAKYIYSICFLLFVFLYFLVVDKTAHVLLNYLDQEPIAIDFWFSFFLISLIILAIYIPFYIKFSFMVAFMIQVISMFVGPFALSAIGYWFVTKTNLWQHMKDFVESFLLFFEKNPFLILIPVTIIVMFISWFISQRIFMKKELA